MIDLLRLNSGVGRGQPNDEEDVAATDNALRDIGAYIAPPEYASEPQRYITAPAVDALESFQEQNGLKIDGYAKPGGPTERAINNRLLGKPRGAGLLHDFDMAVGDTVGNGFRNEPRDVKTVKRALGGLGYLPEDPFDDPSGFIEESTSKAIKGFQGDNRLKVDGWLHPGGETEGTLQQAVDRLARAKAEQWREYRRRAPSAEVSKGIGDIDQMAEPALGLWQLLQGKRDDDAAPTLSPGPQGSIARLLRSPNDGGEMDQASHGAPPIDPHRPSPESESRPTDARQGSSTPEGAGNDSFDPNSNFGSWAIKRSDVLPEGVEPPADPLNPDRLPRDISNEMPRYDAEGRMPPVDVGIDRKREVRFLISRLYRVGARNEDGGYRLNDDEFDRYLAAAKEHIKPEDYPIFELTARAVRAGALDWHVAATRLAAYYAPETTGEAVVDLLLDLTPVVGQLKGAQEAHAALEDAVDAAAYGDERAHAAAIAKAALAIAGLIMPGVSGRALKALQRELGKELHHLIPRYLGGAENSPLLALSRAEHRGAADSLHLRMQEFFAQDPKLRGFAHGPKNPGSQIMEQYTRVERRNALDAFYRSLKGSTVAHERLAHEAWLKIFPEALKYLKP